MKKQLTIAMLLLVGLAASAQGIWTTVKTPADELKGEKGGTHYKYSVEGLGEIEIYDWNDWLFKVTTYDGGFNFDEIKTKQVYNSNLSVRTVPLSTPKYKCNVLMGLYDNNEALKEKIELEMEVDQHQKCQNLTINKSWYFYPQTGRKVKKLFKSMREGKGYLRIVANRKEMPDFDIKITPYSQQQ